MRAVVLFLIVLLSPLQASGPSAKKQPLNKLIDKTDSAWPLVKKLIAEAKNTVEVLPRDSARASAALFEAQVTTHSFIGAIVYETGGIFVDHGWIRILGSGCSQMNRSLMEWNKAKSVLKKGEKSYFVLIADDVLGGFFAINIGGISKDGIGKIWYLSPDGLKWDNMNIGYTDFLNFCLMGDIEKFYKGLRWQNWQKEVEGLDGNTGISFYPPLWTKQGQEDINKDSRKPVPLQELWIANTTKPH